jgi:hypothetical protein
MAYTKVKANQVPKRARKSESRFEKTPEWQAMKADMDRGLKAREALMVSLTQADKEELGITNRRTIARFVQKYLTAKGLPYVVRSFHRDDYDYVIVECTQD